MDKPPFVLERNVDTFDCIDPYNPPNVVRGYINRSGNSTYGALWITHVNGKECPQMIWSTPKMHYPFGDDGFYRVDKSAQAEVYEKYDGTNILAFLYKDADGNSFVSYKTRLRPFLGESKFGDFKRLWDEILDMYKVREAIPSAIKSERMNLSFELYGKRNKILIDYDVPLDYRLLFGITWDGKVIPPTEIETDRFPKATLFDSFPCEHFEEDYKRVREFLNKNLIVVKVEVDGEEKVESMSGMEGAVLYVVKDGAVQYKAKPDAVQDIHWAASKGIPYHSIYTTIVNSYEETDEPTYDLIRSLLLEEFDESQIERRRGTIYKMLDSIKFEKKLKAELREEYLRMGFDIKSDKVTCMRHFGKLYYKRLAGKIYSYLMDEFGGRTDAQKSG